jgi:transposase-like protein
VSSTCYAENSFRYAARRDWPSIAKDLKVIYTAPTEAVALERFVEFSTRWEDKYPAIVGLWERAWAEFVPFLSFDPEIRTAIYTTDDIVKRWRAVLVASGRRRLRRPARLGRRVLSLGRVAA